MTDPVGVPGPPEGWLSLYDYGLIGDQRTAALVSRHGSIDWACFPRFDSPAVFARLLDRSNGGFHEVSVAPPYVSHQQYVGGTNLLTTFFEFRKGHTLTVTDFMPIGRPGAPGAASPSIVRRLVARGSPVPVTIRADPRFDYATLRPTWEVDGEAAIAGAGDDRIGFTAPWAWTLDGSCAVARGAVVPGTPSFAQIRWGGAPVPDASPSQLLTLTDAYWRAWVSPPDAPLRRVAARWHPWVERSELVLSLLSPRDTGVFVAAPTTSLPEAPGYGRNWDYRYVWLRDASFTAQVFLLLGHVREAREYVDWAIARAASLSEGKELQTLYTVDGGTPPDERELPHLEGYMGSRPVRVGNAAVTQEQWDIYGEILDSALLLERADPAFVRSRWEPLRALAQRATELWSRPDRGIWEFRTPPAHYVHSKLMCWVALDRAIQLAEAFGETEPVPQWKAVCEEIRTAILARGWDERRQSFVQAFDRPALDASALRIPIVGFLPPGDPRCASTLSAVEASLDHHGLLRRYEGDDGLEGTEGAFLLCSFWRVEALARFGQMDQALSRWRSLLDLAGPLLLYSEEFDPANGRPLGNFPQAFTHIGVLRAALALGLVGAEH